MLAMTNKMVVIINSLKVPKIKKILLYEMKFLVPNYSYLQNPWLGGYNPQIPILCALCPQLNLLNPPPEQNSWVHHCLNVSAFCLYVALLHPTWLLLPRSWRAHISRNTNILLHYVTLRLRRHLASFVVFSPDWGQQSSCFILQDHHHQYIFRGGTAVNTRFSAALSTMFSAVHVPYVQS